MCRVFGRGQCVWFIACHRCLLSCAGCLVEGSVFGLLCDIGVCCHVQGVW